MKQKIKTNFIKLKQKISENKLLFSVFLISTLFFLFQHYFHLEWDFSSYVLNAKYWFHHGTYFELYRAPMLQTLFGFFLIFGKFGEYLFVIFSSSVFFYANTLLSEKLFKNKKNKDFSKLIFYLASLTPFVLIYATLAGTELLSLAFFEIFLAFLLSKKDSGHFLAFATLTRYNFVLFTPFILLYKKPKKIIRNLIWFTIPFIPWFIYNYFKYTNPLASILDSYALNVFFRKSITQPFLLKQLLPVINWLLPFFIAGILVVAYTMIKNKKVWKHKTPLILFAIFLFNLYDFIHVPFKITRYLFGMSLPIAYFSTYFFIYLKNKTQIRKKLIVGLFLLIFLLSIFAISVKVVQGRQESATYKSAANQIEKMNLTNCEILSPAWVPVTYYTQNVYPLGANNVSFSIKQKKIVLIFKNAPTMDDSFSQAQIDSAPKIYETNAYYLLGNVTSQTCKSKYTYNSRYYQQDYCEFIKRAEPSIGNIGLKVCKLFEKKE